MVVNLGLSGAPLSGRRVLLVGRRLCEAETEWELPLKMLGTIPSSEILRCREVYLDDKMIRIIISCAVISM